MEDNILLVKLKDVETVLLGKKEGNICIKFISTKNLCSVTIFSSSSCNHNWFLGSCPICRYEFKSNHGEWIAKLKPQLTCTVETRVQRAVFTPSSEALRLIAVKVREELRTLMDFLLKACLSPPISR